MISRPLHLLPALALGCAALASSGRAADPVVYSQPASPANFYTTWDSTQTSAGPIAVGFDNFTLPSATSISAVQWSGNYIDPNNPGANPIAPNTSGFTVAFFADNNGYPGQQLATATISQADCAPTLLGTDSFTTSNSIPAYQIPFYSYRAVLPAPFVAAAGQSYWVSIVGNVASPSDNWSWFSSPTGDNRSIQNYQGTQNRDMDRAFALEGAAPAATGAPVASATPTLAKTTVGSGVPAVVTLNLSAPAAGKVNVKYALGGTAVNGTDYQALSGKAKFKPGQQSVDLQIVGQGDLGGAGKKTVTVALLPGNGYTVGSAKPVKVKITKSNVIVLP